jgi:RNA polymerase sigma-70 factor, ECF subfamily
MRPELIRAATLLRKGSPKAVEEAVALLQNTVYSFSMKVCGHPEDAEDTMQEVLYRSLPYLAKIHEPRALAVWLYTVTRNRCWRMRRKPAHAPARMLSLDELMPDDAELAHLLSDASQSPEKSLLSGERQSQLQRAVLEIPVSLRLVLVLHDMEELSTDEVAQVLGLQPGTVRVRLHRARLTLRKILERARESARTPGATRRASKRVPSRGRRSRRPADCRKLFAQLSEYIDRRAGPAACDKMQAHIESCPSCIAFVRDLQSAIERCRSLDAKCNPRVASQLRALLAREYLRLMGSAASKKNLASL